MTAPLVSLATAQERTRLKVEARRMRTRESGVEGHANQGSEIAPGVAIRCGCSRGDEYGYPAGFDVKRGAITNAPIAPTAGIKPGLSLVGFRRVHGVSSGAASKRVVTHAGQEHWTCLPGPRPALAGWGATAAEASPPHQRECETGLASLALNAGEVLALGRGSNSPRHLNGAAVHTAPAWAGAGGFTEVGKRKRSELKGPYSRRRPAAAHRFDVGRRR